MDGLILINRFDFVIERVYYYSESTLRWYHKQPIFKKEVKSQKEEDDDFMKATTKVDDGPALTTRVKSVMTKVKVVLIRVRYKVSLINAYSHGKPNYFIVIKVSTNNTIRFQYRDDLYGSS
jgi:hypothetical protein